MGDRKVSPAVPLRFSYHSLLFFFLSGDSEGEESRLTVNVNRTFSSTEKALGSREEDGHKV